MFVKLSAVALFAAPLAAALTLNPPNAPTSAGSTTITWEWEPEDPPFTLELTHPTFNNKLAIANNVDPAQGELTLDFPVVPAQDGYTLEAVNIGNIDEVYSATGAFAVAPNPNSSFSASSTTSRSISSGASSAVVTPRPSSSGSTGASAFSGSPSSSASPSLTPLNGDDGAASTSVISGLGVLAAAVAGAVVAL